MNIKLFVALLLSICVQNVSAQALPEITVPPGYKLQKLEATDGSVAMPENWHFASRGTPNGWQYIFAEEDLEKNKGSYETGVRIQLLLGMRKNINKSPEDFARGFIESKRKTAKVLEECEEKDRGQFVQKCIVTIEKTSANEFQIIYNVNWGKEMDMVFISTSGTPVEKWSKNKPIFDVMGNAIFIGPNLGKK